MDAVHQFLNIMMVGAVGGIVYTLATHSSAITDAANGVDTIYKTAIGGTLGQIA